MKLEEPFLTDPKQIKAWLNSAGVKGWSIGENGLVDIKGNVDLEKKLGLLKRLPVRFGKVSGSFLCNENQLVSLEGSPNLVGGNFACGHNRLVSLEGAPKKVGGSFYCVNNQLVSLVGSPNKVGEDFYCNRNLLASLEGVAKDVGGTFYCYNNQLLSLKGAPQKVGGGFCCYNNRLASLVGAPKQISGNFDCYNNQLVNLEGSPKVVGLDFWCDHNLLVDFKGLEDVSIGRHLVANSLGGAGQDNVIKSLNGLPKNLYSKLVGLDVQALLEASKKRATSLLGVEAGELGSEVALG